FRNRLRKVELVDVLQGHEATSLETPVLPQPQSVARNHQIDDPVAVEVAGSQVPSVIPGFHDPRKTKLAVPLIRIDEELSLVGARHDDVRLSIGGGIDDGDVAQSFSDPRDWVPREARAAVTCRAIVEKNGDRSVCVRGGKVGPAITVEVRCGDPLGPLILVRRAVQRGDAAVESLEILEKLGAYEGCIE